MLSYDVRGGTATVSRVLAVLDDEDLGLADVANIVMEDPVMTAKILSIANQDWFGLSKHVANPHVAVSLVGPDVVRSVAMLYMVENSDCPPRLRTLSKVTGDTAARDSRLFAVKPAIAQCAGLVLYLGDFMIYQQDRQNYDRLEKIDLLERTREEITLYGVPRDVLTSELLDKWNFPTEVVRGVRERFDSESDFPLARLLAHTEMILQERANDGSAIKQAILSS